MLRHRRGVGLSEPQKRAVQDLLLGSGQHTPTQPDHPIHEPVPHWWTRLVWWSGCECVLVFGWTAVAEAAVQTVQVVRATPVCWWRRTTRRVRRPSTARYGRPTDAPPTGLPTRRGGDCSTGRRGPRDHRTGVAALLAGGREGIGDQMSPQVIGRCPADHATGGHGDDGGQVEPALLCGDVSNVAAPAGIQRGVGLEAPDGDRATGQLADPGIVVRCRRLRCRPRRPAVRISRATRRRPPPAPARLSTAYDRRAAHRRQATAVRGSEETSQPTGRRDPATGGRHIKDQPSNAVSARVHSPIANRLTLTRRKP